MDIRMSKIQAYIKSDFFIFALIVNFFLFNKYMMIYGIIPMVFNFGTQKLLLFLLLLLYLKRLFAIARYGIISRISLIIHTFTLYILFVSIVIYQEQLNIEVLIVLLFVPLLLMVAIDTIDNSGFFNKVIVVQYVILILYTIIYFVNLNILQRSAAIVNSIYYLLLLFPFILCMKYNVLRTIGFIILSFIVFYSEKRTALIALGIAYIVYIFIDAKVNSNFNKKVIYKMASYIGSMIGVLYGYNMLKSEYDIDIIERFSSVSEDGGSGRTFIYNKVFELLSNSSLTELIGGHGYNAVVSYIGISSHNDFLEILFNFGFIGLGFYLVILFYLVSYLYKMIKTNFPFAPQYGASLAIFVIMSLTSHLIFVPSYVGYLVFFWGYCITQYKKPY